MRPRLPADEFSRLKAALAGRLVIERELGQGGMATVYLARDLKHNRQVAVKVLRPELAAALGTERFLREIQIVAKLSHPHILQLHDSGEAEGFLYFVMPFVDGESLRQRLERQGRLPVATAVQLAIEIAGALDYAHHQGIVHRDIKPENILLHTGQAVVSDFGIARAIDAAAGDGSGINRLTTAGVAIGTPPYMSPEQVTGDAVDGRTDVYALGCVLYEMLDGAPPFRGPSQRAVLAQHSIAPVPPLKHRRAEVGAALERALYKALAKAPDDRFASAEEFRAALTGAAPVPAPPLRWPLSRQATAVLALVAAAVLVVLLAPWRPPKPVELMRSIAVLALKSDSGGEPFSEGVSEEITTALGKVPGLLVAARSRAFSFKGKNLGAQEIGRQLQVRYVLDGGVRIGGTHRRVSVQLTDVTTGIEVWSEEYDRDASDPDVFSVQDSIARAVVEKLRIHLSGPARAALATRSTHSPEAHDLYLKGRFAWNQRGSGGGPAALQRSIEFFREAIALDSNYAQAWAGLADAYSVLPGFGRLAPAESFALARAAAERAVTLDSTLADAHRSLGIIAIFHDWDWTTAGREFGRALALDSTEADTHLFHAWYYVCLGRFDDALGELHTAQRLDPVSAIINARVGTMLWMLRRYGEAESALRQAIDFDSTNGQARMDLGFVLATQHRYQEAIAAGPPRSVRGYVYGLAGRRAEAQSIQDSLEQMAREGYVSPVFLSLIPIGLGDTARALDWLERGYRERAMVMIFLSWPVFDPLRGQPRFHEIVRGIGLTIPPLAGGKTR
jgi:TolB-like protein/tRNA A-37 threonylcarbamoyl transferase component Bud32